MVNKDSYAISFDVWLMRFQNSMKISCFLRLESQFPGVWFTCGMPAQDYTLFRLVFYMGFTQNRSSSHSS